MFYLSALMFLFTILKHFNSVLNSVILVPVILI